MKLENNNNRNLLRSVVLYKSAVILKLSYDTYLNWGGTDDNKVRIGKTIEFLSTLDQTEVQGKEYWQEHTVGL